MSRLALQTGLAATAAFAVTLAVSQWLGGGHAAQAEAPAAPPLALAATTAPAGPPRPSVVPMAADGHYWVDAAVDGRHMRMMVDTGASLVAITPEDARRLGLSLRPEDYNRRLRTANGDTRAARVVLPSLSVGGIKLNNVEAMVVEGGLPHSLLGMSFLTRLSGFSANPASMTFTP